MAIFRRQSTSAYAILLLLMATMFIGCASQRSGLTGSEESGATQANRYVQDTSKTDPIPAEEKRTGNHSSAHVKSDQRDTEANPDKVPVDTQKFADGDKLASMLTESHVATGDLVDSASAVDDDIWRQFDLAEEYHSMGVVANREASWEEAQYYFEKGLKTLAALDIEADSADSEEKPAPEAARYSELLENIVADYRVTLRSLGNLTGDVSASVVIERFGDIIDRLPEDSLKVYKQERQEVVYDIPITMNDRVKRSIVYFQTVAKDAFKKYLRRSKKYTPMMKEILIEFDLPQDMIYLSLIESGFNPHAYSWARAMGLWQFISSTGKMYGLKRNWWIDERKDPVKSTRAAATFLKELYQKFGSWELAWAAYNGGPGRVSRTIKKQRTKDFWKLKLKRQTMDYVPLIMAAAVIGKNPEKYGFENKEFEAEVIWDEVTIKRCLDLRSVAKAVGCSLKELKTLNPELLRGYTPPNLKEYKLKVPVGTTPTFYAALENMPSPKETSWVKHEIRRGETVSTIASKYGVSQYAIFEANNLGRRSRIYAGKELIVPVPLDREYASNSNKGRKRDYKAANSIYTVRSGDTMWDIARAFGTSVNALRQLNYIERGSRIYVGQKMKIPSTSTRLASRNNSISNNKSSKRSTKSNSSGKASSSKYTVRSGDTIWEIARRYGTTTARIRALNGLGRSSRIYPGQVLSVKSGEGVNYILHKVRRGESLSAIASKYRTSIARIVANNDIGDPDRLSIGTRLKIYTK